MKRLILSALAISVFHFNQAQNLVPNDNFEQYSTCPDGASQIDSALFWFNPAVYPGPGGSSDYFNACSSSPWAGVPYNWNGNGYQPAYNGDGYAGLYLYYSTFQNFREYIEVPLDTPLMDGMCYHFSMQVNLANVSEFTSDDIGAYFSNTMISGVNNYDNLPYTPQVNNTVGDFDTLSWKLVEGDYVATGGESYLIIGNFKTDGSTTLNSGNSAGNIPGVYCYVDDVQLSICVGVEEHNRNLNTAIYPNPTTGRFQVTVPQVQVTAVFDVLGNAVPYYWEGNTIDISHLQTGTYLVQLTTEGATQTRLLMKQ